MQDFFKGVRFKILIGILTVMVGFMIAAIYTGGTAPLMAQVVRFVTEPIQQFATSVTGGVSNYFNKYVNAAKTYEENKLLREENNELRRRLVEFERLRYDYEQMQKIADTQQSGKDYATASVIERDYSTAFASFTIDKGSLDDVSQYDPVVSEGDSLVGYVAEVGLSTSRVITLLDVDMNIAASNSATRDVGSVTGTVDFAQEGLCLMEYLPRDSETAPGDIVVTSGGSLFPKDLVIGSVTEVLASSRGNSLEAVLQPAADVKAIKDVFVITQFEGQGAD